MANQVQPSNSQPSDEIDLGQLLQLIKRGLHNLSNFFLRIFIYLKRNSLKLIGLVIVGIAISYGLSQIISKKFKTEVIVRPNFESKNYLYDVIAEISANLEGRNEMFFEEMDVLTSDLVGFKVNVEAIEDEEIKTDDNILNEMKYLEVLQNFKDESFVIDILRSELSEKSVIDHKITFTYKDATSGPATVQKMINYIDTNEFYKTVKKVSTENAKSRIEENTNLINQIDRLVENYTKALLTDKENSKGGAIYMEKEKSLNVPTLLTLKNELNQEIEETRIEMAEQSGVLSIINFGKTQEVKKSFFNGTYFLIPTLLIAAFLMLSFFQYLNQKAKEIQ